MHYAVLSREKMIIKLLKVKLRKHGRLLTGNELKLIETLRVHYDVDDHV